MLFNCRLYYRDKNANSASVGFGVLGVNSKAELLSVMSLMESRISAMSDAVLVKGTARYQLIDEPTGSLPEANLWEWLIVYFSNGSDYASISIPAPSSFLEWEVSGNYRQIRILPGENATTNVINALMERAENWVTPWGDPFPTGQWVAGRSQNQ